MLNIIKNIALVTGLMWQVNAWSANQKQHHERAAKEAYEYGHVVMQTKDWREAITAFEQAAENNQLKAASHYWQAYAYYQLKQKAQAKRLLERLIKNNPESEWVDDAEVLLFEHGDGGKQASKQAELDDELKLFTLQQIMFNQPEKALPKVYDMLEKSDSVRVKMNAIQLLGLSDQPEVVDYLFRFIKQENNRDLQHQALQMLSLRDGKSSRQKLEQLYETSQDQELKAGIIQSFIHHDDNNQLIAMLNKEQDPELSMYLIQMLGIKGESAALKDRYESSQGDHRRAILEALALSGDAKFLYAVIDQEKDPEIRQQAIHSLIMVDDANMGDYLIKLYEKAESSAEKDIIANVLVTTGVEPGKVVKLFESDASTERKRSLLHTLMAMDAVTELKQVYETESDPEIRQAIIRQLGAMDASQTLMELYQKDPSAVEEKVFFEAIGMSSEPLDEDFLMDRFRSGDARVKDGVLQALLMQDNVDVMVKLLKSEKDLEVKKKIIQMISITDAEALLDVIEDQ